MEWLASHCDTVYRRGSNPAIKKETPTILPGIERLLAAQLVNKGIQLKKKVIVEVPKWLPRD
jgi:hypothetical protein